MAQDSDGNGDYIDGVKQCRYTCTPEVGNSLEVDGPGYDRDKLKELYDQQDNITEKMSKFPFPSVSIGVDIAVKAVGIEAFCALLWWVGP